MIIRVLTKNATSSWAEYIGFVGRLIAAGRRVVVVVVGLGVVVVVVVVVVGLDVVVVVVVVGNSISSALFSLGTTNFPPINRLNSFKKVSSSTVDGLRVDLTVFGVVT